MNPIFLPKIRSIGGNSGLRDRRTCVGFLIYLNSLLPFGSRPSKRRHLHFGASSGKRAISRRVPSNLSPLRRSVPGARNEIHGHTGHGRQAEKKGREGRKCCTGAAKRGGQCCRAGGSARRYPPASGRRLCIYACFATIACFLPITGSPSVPGGGNPGHTTAILAPRRFHLRADLFLWHADE